MEEHGMSQRPRKERPPPLKQTETKPLNDGGPAFPSKITYPGLDETGDYRGMTLRDYFAAKAMQGIISNAGTMREITKVLQNHGKDDEYEFYRVLAEISFDYAGAMLKARKKGSGDEG